MTGVKGKSGGKRVGAGRKPTPVVPVVAREAKPASSAPVTDAGYDDPLAYLRAVWTGAIDSSPAQVRAAQAALPFVHQKLGEGGKKEGKQAAAEKAAGRFGAAAAPKLAASGGKKVG